jgi:hypothetical protein
MIDHVVPAQPRCSGLDSSATRSPIALACRRVPVSECQPKSPVAGPSTLIKNRGVLPGFVEAPDQKAAELMAAKTFMLSEWQRKRLLVRERI